MLTMCIKRLTLLGIFFLFGIQSYVEAQTSLVIQVRRDIIYGTVNGIDLKLDVYKPNLPGPLPAIIFVHGGGWVQGDKRTMEANARYFAERGYLGVSVNYRLGPIIKFPAEIEDVKCAIRWVRSHATEIGVNPEKIGALGSSAGGHLVGLLGTTDGSEGFEGNCGDHALSSRVQAVVPYFGPMDLIQLFRNNPNGSLSLFEQSCRANPEPCKAASPITYVSSDDPPFLLVHGTKDPVVPFEQSVLMREALKTKNVEAELVAIEGAGHGWPINSPPGELALARALPFFDKFLKAK
jgi:acetyl esterase/lipase